MSSSIFRVWTAAVSILVLRLMVVLSIIWAAPARSLFVCSITPQYCSTSRSSACFISQSQSRQTIFQPHLFSSSPWSSSMSLPQLGRSCIPVRLCP